MKRPQYGIDASNLLRFFFIAGTVSCVILVALFISIASSSLKVIISLIFGIATIYLLGMGCLMMYFSQVVKLKDKEKSLDLVQQPG